MPRKNVTMKSNKPAKDWQAIADQTKASTTASTPSAPVRKDWSAIAEEERRRRAVEQQGYERTRNLVIARHDRLQQAYDNGEIYGPTPSKGMREAADLQYYGSLAENAAQHGDAATYNTSRAMFDRKLDEMEERTRQVELRRQERAARDYGKQVETVRRTNPSLAVAMTEDAERISRGSANTERRVHELTAQIAQDDKALAGYNGWSPEYQAIKDRKAQNEAALEKAKRAGTVFEAAAGYQQQWQTARKYENMIRSAAEDPNKETLIRLGKRRFESDNENAVLEPTNPAKQIGPEYSDAADKRFMTEGDEALFYYLYARDPVAAKEFADYANSENRKAYLNQQAETAGATPWNRINATLAGTAANLAAGPLWLATGGGEQAADLTRWAKAQIGGASQGLTEKGVLNTGFGAGTLPESLPVIGGKGLGEIYQLGSSMLQSATVAAGFGALGAGLGLAGKAAQKFASWGGAALLGSAAAAADYTEMLDQGLPKDKAMLHAAFAGVAEMLFEQISLDNLLSQDFAEKTSFIKNALTQAGIEASEEINTTLANTLTDELIRGSQSSRHQRMRELIAEGMTLQEARRRANAEWLSDLLYDGVSGALSGGLMTAGNLGIQRIGNAYDQSVIRSVNNESTGRAVRGDNELIDALNGYARDHTLKEIAEDGAKTGDTSSALRAPSPQGEGGERIAATGENTGLATTGSEASAKNAEASGDASLRAETESAEDGKSRRQMRKEAREQKRQAKRDTAAARQLGARANAILDHIDEQLTGKTLAESESMIAETKKKYPALTEILNDSAERASGKLYARAKTLDELETMHRDNVKGVSDRALRNAAGEAYALNAARFAENGDQRAKILNNARWSIRNGALELSASYTGADGASVQSEVSGLTQDGKRVVLSDGSTHSVDALDLDADTKDILGKIVKYGLGKYADTVFRAYQSSVESGDVTSGYGFLSEFLTAMAYGRTNVATVEQALARTNRTVTPEAAIRLAYGIGEQQSQAERSGRQSAVPTAESEGGRQSAVPTAESEGGRQSAVPTAESEGGRQSDGLSETERKRTGKTVSGREGRIDASRLGGQTVSKDAQRQINLWAQITKRLGIETVLFASELDENGKYSGMNGEYRDGKLWIDVNAGKLTAGDVSGFLRTVAHELTHFGKEYSPAFYEELKRFAFAVLGEKRGPDAFDNYVARKLERDRTGRLTVVDAEEEIIADACETMLRNSEVVRQALERDRKPVERVIRKILDFFKRLVGAAQHDEAKVFEQFTDKLTELQRLWDRMILDAAEAHRETGDIKNTADEGGEETIQLSERDEEAFKPFSDKINDVVSKAIDGEGRIDGKNKTIPIIPVGPKLVAMVSASSKNAIRMNERMLAINPGITWHEYRRHTKVSDEISRNQIAFTKRQFLNAIKAIVSPDMVECLFTDPANPTQQQSFAVVKRTNRGRYIVVEAVGGNQNQTIYPVMILQFTHSKWNNMMKQGLTLGEILYSDNQKKLAALDVAQNKNSRVTAAKFASLAAFATDDSTSYPPHSPRLKDNISQLDAESNPSDENNSGKRSERDRAEHDAEYLAAVKRGDMETAQRMVDEAAQAAGYNLHLYHGSKSGGGFTVFKDWQYFTENKAYADRYKNRDTGKGLYSVYVKADRIFDTRKAADRAIFHELRDEYGLSRLQENGLPDWTDGYDLSEIIEEKGLDYDGILLDEGNDVFNGKVSPKGNSYVVRKSNLVKLADPVTYDDSGNVIPLSERFNTKNDDIRYSEREEERPWQMDPSRDYLAEAQEELFGKEFLKALEAPWKSSKAGEAFDALIDDRNSRERAREEWFHGTAQDAFDALMDKHNRSEGAEPERLDESAQDYGGDAQEAFDAFLDDLNSREGAAEEWFNGKGQEAFDDYFAGVQEKARAKIRKRIEKAKEKAYERAYNNARERQKKTELRGRIRNLRKDMARRVTNPSERTHLPAGLAESVADVLDFIDGIATPREGTKAQQEYREMLAAVRRTARNYAALERCDDPVWRAEYDEKIRQQLAEIEQILETKYEVMREKMKNGAEPSLEDAIKKLTSGELQSIYDTLKTIRDTLRDASKLLNQELMQDYMRDVYETAEEVTAQQNTLTRKGVPESLKAMIRRNGVNTMRAVEIMSGFDRNAALYRLWAAIEEGTDTANRWIMHYDKALNELRTGKNEKTYRDSLTKRLDYGLREVDEYGNETGRDVKITKQQVIQLVMSWDREARARIRHLERGGAKIETEDSKPGVKRRARVFISPETMSEMRKSLTAWDKAYMETMRSYLKSEGRETNKVLYALKHRALALEDFYVPLIVDDSYLEAKITEDNYDRLFTKGFGSTEQMQVNAPQPLVIDGMEQMMRKHVSDAANYIGLAMPIRDFAKVYNARLASDNNAPGSEEKLSYTTAATALKRNFDDAAKSTMLKTLAEVQGVRGGNNWRTELGDYLNKLQGAFVRSALLVNPSVTIKQFASYYAAFSILSQQALTRGNRARFAHTDAAKAPSMLAYLFANPRSETAQRLYDEIDRHTAEHEIRRRGMDYTEFGERALREGKLGALIGNAGARMEQKKLGHAARKALAIANPGNWIQRADVATTATLWIACKEQARMNGFKAGTDDFWNETTKLYKRCLRETQPMYDPLHRAGVQKSDGLMRYLFPFRTVPIQNHGQLAMAYEAWKHTGGEAKKQAAGFLRKTVWAQAGSAAIFAMMTAVAAGMKRKTGKYRDKDEELTILSLLAGLGSDYLSVWASNALPLLGSETVEFGQTAVKLLRGTAGRTYDTVSVGMADMINSTVNAVYAVLRETEKVMSGDAKDSSKLLDKVYDLGLNMATMAGIPAKTMRSYLAGAIGNVKDFAEGRIPAWNDESYEGGSGSEYDPLRKAIDKNKDLDAEKAKLKEAGKTDSQIKSAISSYLNEQYRTGAYDEDKYTKYLARYLGVIKPAEVEERINAGKCWREFGVTPDEANTAYRDGKLDAEQMKKLLTGYGGKSAQEADVRIAALDFGEEHPELGWSVTTAESYLAKTPKNTENAQTPYPADMLITARDAGIRPEQYDEYLETAKGLKKDEALGAIDELALTDKQKDWLYALNGWAWGEVDEAPWR